MAIGYRSGYLRKKIGDMVMFVNQNVNGKVKQVARAYTAEVKNPKTARQSNQRSLFVAAKNFRRGFESLLNHSWQGKKYGVQSLNRFSQLVLANKGANYPGFFLQPKNSMKFIPQPWPLATGSIAGAPAPSFLGIDEVRVGLNDISSGEWATKGAFDTALLAANPFLKDGDMITICAVLSNHDLQNVTTTDDFMPVYDRYVIDVNSTAPYTTFNNELITENGVFECTMTSDGAISLGRNMGANSIVAIGVIYSRLSASGSTWERSTSTMVVASAIQDIFNDTEYVDNCIATFMDESMLTSDWYLNQVGQDTTNPSGGGGSTTESYHEGRVALKSGSSIANGMIVEHNGQSLPVTMSSTKLYAVVKTNGLWVCTEGQNEIADSYENYFDVATVMSMFPGLEITVVTQP